MKCSVCNTEIEQNFCPKCGQYHKKNRISFKTILEDIFGSIFSIDKSFFSNIKMGLFQPEILITNYWNGFRGYYYSPGKFLMIASLFLLFPFSSEDGFFLIHISGNIAPNFVLLTFLIILFSLLSFIVYFKLKKNFWEHLILNIYNISLWTIIFVPISLLFSFFKWYSFSDIALYTYLLLIIIWNSKAFEMNKLKRFLYVTINLILLIIPFILM
jgi:hypothetical protein